MLRMHVQKVEQGHYSCAHRMEFGVQILALDVCVAQDFSQALTIALVWVRYQSVYLSAFLTELFTSLFPSSEGCDPGMYLAVDDTCLPCPANSNSTQSGASVCPCFEGYYRAAEDPPEMECTRKSHVVLESRACSMVSSRVGLGVGVMGQGGHQMFLAT